MERRNFLRLTVAGAASAALGGAAWDQAFAAGKPVVTGPYGPLGTADANGIALPSGFTSRVIARSSQAVPGTSYTWHGAPDGGACFADGSGWIYVSNSEITGTGGASAVSFDSAGSVTGARRILSNTDRNCAGGATPWNTWLSGEEVATGYVWETDPWGVNAAVARPAMGRFTHEACAADPDHGYVYLTEDVSDSGFYRFRPTTWGDLSTGTLEVMVGDTAVTNGPVTWAVVPDPDGSPTATRYQVAGTKRFNGGEGCYYAAGTCWFTTKGDNRVWAYDATTSSVSLAYDPTKVRKSPLSGVDNVTRSEGGDLFIAEDGGNMEICLITPEGQVSPFLRISGQSSSEICGPAFTPDGSRLYFSSQRGTSGSSSGGITYEVTGPFRS